MTADRRVPLAWLYVLVHGTVLQINLPLRIENMDVNNRVQQKCTRMTLFSSSLAYDIAIFVYNGK
jgi:hypothetical protein